MDIIELDIIELIGKWVYIYIYIERQYCNELDLGYIVPHRVTLMLLS